MGEAVARSKQGMEEEASILPRMFMRVLLVEADDSTRQIIAALLRKCSYRVAAVSDGLKAWETLKGRPHSIDLILTEVELPSISGYALLALVMEHDICKNIPVIMMSSQDSISVVLKCILKGAADFLIKPVRRNELRNLWCHVWRRQTQTIGHVSENTVAELDKEEVTSENNAASNNSSDYLDSTPKKKECSEKGSDAQGLSQLKWGSGSKMSDTNNYGERVMLVEKSLMPRSEIGGKSIGIEPESASCNESYKSTVVMGNDLVCDRIVAGDADLGPESYKGHSNKNIEVHFLANDLGEPSSGALDLIGKFGHHPKETCGISNTNDETNNFCFTPNLELSLRRFHPSYPKNEATDEGHILNHSIASAFSRYNDGKASRSPFPTLIAEVKEHATTFPNELPYHSSKITAGTQSHGAALSCQENMSSLYTGQSGNSVTAFTGPQVGLIPVPGVKFDVFDTGYGQIFPPILYTQSCLTPLWGPEDQREQSPFLTSSSLNSSSEFHNSEQGYFPCEETTNCSAGQTMKEDNNLESVKLMRQGSATPGRSGISSLCNGIASKLDSDASENVCNGCDGDAILASSSVRTSVTESVDDNRFFIRDGSRGTDSHCSSQREAALLKFRLKRKDRCYEKKVRYQSRKKLAEERPRVKGQFVRRAQTDLAPPES